jgi:hypothetical protein
MEAPMPKTLEKWTVQPHGPLTQIDDGIWTVTGQIEMPLTHFERRMTVVRLNNGKLVIYSAIALDEPEMQVLEAAGTPGYLIIPGDHHRADAKIWKDRYPSLVVIAPAGAEKAAEKVVHVDATDVDFDDDQVAFLTVDGLAGHEAALLVRHSSGSTLVVNDIIGNLPSESGFVLRIMGFSGNEPHVPLPIKAVLGDRKASLRQQLDTWAREPNLKRIIVSHGEPLETNSAEALRQLADSLS